MGARHQMEITSWSSDRWQIAEDLWQTNVRLNESRVEWTSW